MQLVRYELVAPQEEELSPEQTCLVEDLEKLAGATGLDTVSYPFLGEDPSQEVCRSGLEKYQTQEVCQKVKLFRRSVTFNMKGFSTQVSFTSIVIRHIYQTALYE